MSMNNKNLEDIARQLGLSGENTVSKREIERLSSKSDAELEREILRIKEQLKAKNIGYEKQIAMLRSIAPMMDREQRVRLNKVIEMLRP